MRGCQMGCGKNENVETSDSIGSQDLARTVFRHAVLPASMVVVHVMGSEVDESRVRETIRAALSYATQGVGAQMKGDLFKFDDEWMSQTQIARALGMSNKAIERHHKAGRYTRQEIMAYDPKRAQKRGGLKGRATNKARGA